MPRIPAQKGPAWTKKNGPIYEPRQHQSSHQTCEERWFQWFLYQGPGLFSCMISISRSGPHSACLFFPDQAIDTGGFFGQRWTSDVEMCKCGKWLERETPGENWGTSDRLVMSDSWGRRNGKVSRNVPRHIWRSRSEFSAVIVASGAFVDVGATRSGRAATGR